MRPRSSAVQWIVAWLLLGGLLAAGFLAAVYQRNLLAAAGLTRDGAPSTIPASMFAPESTPTASSTPPPAGTGLIGPAALPSEGPLPARQALEGRLNSLDRAKLLPAEGGTPVLIAYEVVDVDTGDVVAANAQDLPLIPASNTKTLTTVAVMNAFTGKETFATRVVQPAAGQIVLVGGGDPLLLSVPAKAGTDPQPPTTLDLATTTAEALKASGQTSVTLGYDASLADEGWNQTWPPNYRDQVTQLSALWVDEGRVAGVRSRTPALAAAEVFAAQLVAQGITVTGAPTAAAGTGTELARVESLPVHVLVEQAMNRSNNSFTEVLGFQLALKTGHPSTFAGSVAAIEEQLTALGLWTQGSVLHDASGLSRSNLVTAGMLTEAVRTLAVEPRLSVLLDGLPTAGVTGTLADRFTDATSRPARGVARAKDRNAVAGVDAGRHHAHRGRPASGVRLLHQRRPGRLRREGLGRPSHGRRGLVWMLMDFAPPIHWPLARRLARASAGALPQLTRVEVEQLVADLRVTARRAGERWALPTSGSTRWRQRHRVVGAVGWARAAREMGAAVVGEMGLAGGQPGSVDASARGPMAPSPGRAGVSTDFWANATPSPAATRSTSWRRPSCSTSKVAVSRQPISVSGWRSTSRPMRCNSAPRPGSGTTSPTACASSPTTKPSSPKG